MLAADLDKDSVDNFVNLVNDYNGLVGSTGLTGDFTKCYKTEYDVEKSTSVAGKEGAILSGQIVGLILHFVEK